MEQIKQTVLSAGKDAWNFLTGVTMSAAPAPCFFLVSRGGPMVWVSLYLWGPIKN